LHLRTTINFDLNYERQTWEKKKKKKKLVVVELRLGIYDKALNEKKHSMIIQQYVACFIKRFYNIFW
jgi:hypothetical protein